MSEQSSGPGLRSRGRWLLLLLFFCIVCAAGLLWLALNGWLEVGNLRPAAERQDQKVVLVGLDGADWGIIDSLIAEEKLPHIAFLLEHGSSGPLRSERPLISPILWNTIATGRSPLDHGVWGFWGKALDEKVVLARSTFRQVPALWNIATAFDVRVGFIGWYTTWPPEPVHGFIVSDRIHMLQRSTAVQMYPLTYPHELLEELQPLIVPPANFEEGLVRRFFPGLEESLQGQLVEKLTQIVAETDFSSRLAEHLYKTRRPSLFGVYFQGIDVTSHLFASFAQPKLPHVSDSDFAIYHDVVSQFYQYQDEVLGRLLDQIDKETILILCSDHGFKTGDARPAASSRIGEGHAALWHRREGILIVYGQGVKKRHRIANASIYDVAPTILWLLGMPVAENLEGQVLQDIFEEGVIQRAILPIQSYPDRQFGTASASPAGVHERELLERLQALGYIGAAATETEANLALNSHNRGLFLLARDDLPGAEGAFREALRMAPHLSLAQEGLALVYLRQGSLDGAEELLETAVEADPDSFFPYLGLGRIYHLRGDNQQAEKMLLRAQILAPWHPEPLYRLGLFAHSSGEIGRSTHYLSRSLALTDDGPTRSQIHNLIGLNYVSQEEWGAAAKSFYDALQEDSSNLKSWINRGNVARIRKRAEEAEEAYRQVIELAPSDVRGYNLLAKLYLERRLFANARPILERSLQMNPNQAEIRDFLEELPNDEGDD